MHSSQEFVHHIQRANSSPRAGKKKKNEMRRGKRKNRSYMWPVKVKIFPPWPDRHGLCYPSLWSLQLFTLASVRTILLYQWEFYLDQCSVPSILCTIWHMWAVNECLLREGINDLGRPLKDNSCSSLYLIHAYVRFVE